MSDFPNFDFSKLLDDTKVEESNLDENKFPTTGLQYLFDTLHSHYSVDTEVMYASLLNRIVTFHQHQSESVLEALSRFRALRTEVEKYTGKLSEHQFCIHFLKGVRLTSSEEILLKTHLAHIYKVTALSDYKLQQVQSVLELMFKLQAESFSKISDDQENANYTHWQTSPYGNDDYRTGSHYRSRAQSPYRRNYSQPGRFDQRSDKGKGKKGRHFSPNRNYRSQSLTTKIRH